MKISFIKSETSYKYRVILFTAEAVYVSKEDFDYQDAHAFADTVTEVDERFHNIENYSETLEK